MVLKTKLADANQMYLLGLGFLLVGILCERIGRGVFPAVLVDLILPGTGIPSVLEGIFTGIAIPFLMAAIFFQLRSLCMRRNRG